MRISPITEASTQHQSNPHVNPIAGSESTGKNASLSSFRDCLRSKLQENAVTAISSAESGFAANLLGGYFMPQWASVNPELRNRARAKNPPVGPVDII